MSMQAVRDFWQKARGDTALQAKLKAVPNDSKEKTVAAVVKIAADAGFAFTAEEYQAAVKEELARQHAAGQLSEDQLEQAAAAGNVEQSGQWTQVHICVF